MLCVSSFVLLHVNLEQSCFVYSKQFSPCVLIMCAGWVIFGSISVEQRIPGNMLLTKNLNSIYCRRISKPDDVHMPLIHFSGTFQLPWLHLITDDGLE